MTQGKRTTAVLTAICLVAVGLSEYARTPQTIGVKAVPVISSLMEFYQQVMEMETPQAAKQTFGELRFHQAQQRLYRDGSLAGNAMGEFAVVDGELMADKRMMTGQTEGEAEYVSLAAAEKLIGCEIRQDGEETVVHSPFSSCTLIVKAAGDPDSLGAIEETSGYRDLHVLRYASAADAFAAYKQYQQMDDVEYVTPNRTFRASLATEINGSVTTIPAEEKSWGVDAMGADTYCDWLTENQETLPEITVAVLDTGIYYEHAWLQGRISEGGRSFSEADDGIPDDQHGHGSHCAGIIASSTPDNVKILPIQVLDADDGYGTSLEIYCGMMYALEQGVDVASMSLGGLGEDPLMDEAAEMLVEADIKLCVAAGNESMDTAYSTPANNPCVISVAAVDEWMLPADFTNYGEHIDFAAPGVDIQSCDITEPNALVEMSGTSMATPFVAAACANLLSVDPTLTFDALYEKLVQSCQDLGEPGFDDVYGHGMIDLEVAMDPDRCKTPTASEPGGQYDGSVTVSLSTETEGASIYYTLDNTVPTPETGLLYTEPLTFTQSAYLRAIATDGDTISTELTALYTIDGIDVEGAVVIENGVLVKYNGVQSTLDLTDESFITVGENAFRGNTSIDTIYLPDSVTTIANSAFANSEVSYVRGSGLTTVGDYAFANCGNLYAFPFAQLTHIGEYAFSGALWYADSVDASMATEIGRYAFSSTGASTFFFPSSMTSLPEGVLMGCYYLNYISAPAVTKVGAYSLAIVPVSVGDMIDPMTRNGDAVLYDFDCSAITELGDYALCGFRFGGREVFSSLQVIGDGALIYVEGTELYFPTLTELPADSLMMFAVERVYFENVTTIGSMAILSANTLVFSEALVECDADAWINVMQIAAPANSEAKTIAYARSCPFLAIPCFAEQDVSYEVMQYVPVTLEAVAYDFDVTYQWYQVGADGTRTALPDATSSALTISTAVPGVYSYEVDANCGGTVITATRTVTVNEKTIDGVLDMEKPLIQVWSDAPIYCYTFTPDTDGVYYFSIDDTDISYSSYESSLILNIQGSDWTDSIGMTYGGELSYTLNGGETYHILMYRDNDRTDMANTGEWISSLTILPGTRYDRLEITYCDMILDEDQFFRSTDTFEPICPDVTITDSLTTLVASTDYMLTYWSNDRIGTAVICAVGLGNYYGMAVTTFDIQRSIAADEQITVSLAENDTQTYFFTPEESGLYRFMTGYTQEQMAAFVNEELRPTEQDTDSMIKIYAEETGEYYENDDGSSLYAYLEAELTEGVCYEVSCMNYSGSEDAFMLYITQTKSSMQEVNASCDDWYLPWRDDSFVPTYQVETADGTMLVEGEDYTATLIFDDTPGESAFIFLEGINNYIGGCYIALEVGVGAQTSVNANLVLDETVTQNTTKALYLLELKDTVLLEYVSTDVSATASFLLDDAVLVNRLSGGEQAELKAGTYYVYIEQSADMAQSHTISLLKTLQLIEDAEVTIPDMVYTGASLMPTVTVTLDGVVLTEGEDYEINLYEDMIAPGQYYVEVIGINDYTGLTSGTFRIVPEPDETNLPITTGSYIATISEPSSMVFYYWEPGEGSFLISNAQYENVVIQVFDENYDLCAMLSGLDQTYTVAETLADTRYVLAVGFNGAKMTGEISFDILSDYQLLDACTVEGADAIAIGTEYETIPDYKVLAADGVTELTEGVDYRIRSTANTTRIGQAVITLQGIGDYYGILEYHYSIYDEMPTEVLELALSEQTEILPEYPAEQFHYSFTAPADGTYHVTTEELYVRDYNSLVYDESGAFIGTLQKDGSFNSFTLKEGETLTFTWIVPMVDMQDYPQSYAMTFSIEAYQVMTEYGVTYEVYGSKAMIVAIDPDYVGIYIPDYMGENDELIVDVTEETLMELMNHTQTIYLDSDSELGEALKTMDLCVAFFDSDTTLTGDVTGEGALTINDALTLHRWLTEGKGMFMSDHHYSLADHNGDGAVTILDVESILNAIAL